MATSIRSILRNTLTRELLIDLEDETRARSLKAFEVVRDGFKELTPLRARSLEGQARFRVCEQGFEDVCALHGGRPLEGGLIPNTDWKVHQPFMRFEHDGQGVILALASMPTTGTLPTKNKSRLAGVRINYELSPRLDFDGKGPKIGDIFVVLLVARDRDRAGQIEEIAVGVIDSSYDSFLFYQPLPNFLAVDVPEAPTATPPEPPSLLAAEQPQVTLKRTPKMFRPPEAPSDDEEGGGSA